uniref:TSC22 domain family protein 1 n=1 Tax=Salmo trutta TaxID=8032 RepID=A0A673XLR1_SALTR
MVFSGSGHLYKDNYTVFHCVLKWLVLDLQHRQYAYHLIIHSYRCSVLRLFSFHSSSSSGASVVAIDNKIEQAMDLVKSHLMYAVREEVEVLKEQIKELIERNSQLEQENSLLKTLASPEQMAQFQAQTQAGSPPTSTQPPAQTQAPALPPTQLQPTSHNSGPSA